MNKVKALTVGSTCYRGMAINGFGAQAICKRADYDHKEDLIAIFFPLSFENANLCL